MDGGLGPVEPSDEFPDAAGVAHVVVLLPAGSLVDGVDAQPGVEEGLLPHAGVEDVVVVDGGVGEHLGVGLKGDHGAPLFGIAGHGHLLGDLAPGEFHLIDLAVLVDLDLQPLAEGVDHAGAHAVEAAGHLVAAAAELTAGVEDGVDRPPGRAARSGAGCPRGCHGRCR